MAIADTLQIAVPLRSCVHTCKYNRVNLTIIRAGIADSLHDSWLQPFQPKLHMTDEDFLSITHNGRLCDAEGGLGLKEFELVMRNQVHLLPPHACFEPVPMVSFGIH